MNVKKRQVNLKDKSSKKLKTVSNPLKSTTDKCWSIHAPREILIKIFSHVLKNNIIEIKNISKVCKLWNSVSDDEFLWRNVNLANKKFNYDKFLSHSISKNKFKYTWSLNLSGSNELKHEDLESILKQSQNLNSLSISECKKLKSDSLKLIADYCSNLENLNISSFSVRFFIVRNYVLIMLLYI